MITPAITINNPIAMIHLPVSLFISQRIILTTIRLRDNNRQFYKENTNVFSFCWFAQQYFPVKNQSLPNEKGKQGENPIRLKKHKQLLMLFLYPQVY
jgi:hypothetical protein